MMTTTTPLEQILKVSKLDCVRRQLEIASELFFMDRDPVSIHTLASAAHQILSDINKKRKGAPMMFEVEALKGIVLPGKEQEVIKLMRNAANFMKHADNDPEGVLDFRPDGTLGTLWEAGVKYRELTGEETPQITAIRFWFELLHADVFIYPGVDPLKHAHHAQTVLAEGKRAYFDTVMKSRVMERRF